jgi:predicted GNAT family N-acyltransferase
VQNPKHINCKICTYGDSLYLRALAVRDEILRKPLGLTFSNRDIKEEANHHFLVALDGAKVVGTSQWFRKEEEVIRIKQVSVLYDYQSKGVGRLMNEFIEQWCDNNQVKTIELHARKVAFGFYSRLGFEFVGEEFLEVDIPHKKMMKKI